MSQPRDPKLTAGELTGDVNVIPGTFRTAVSGRRIEIRPAGSDPNLRFYPGGTEWTVERVVRVIDGDTVRVIRSRNVNIDGNHYQLIDADPKGVPIRLTWVDTPERGQEGYADAAADLYRWITGHQFTGISPAGIAGVTRPLRVVCYETAGWDRLLGDLIDADGNSASQWMMRERGWPAYQGKT